MGTAQGALSGAGSGAMAGSTFGPYGTAIGAGLGALSGFMASGQAADGLNHIARQNQKAVIAANSANKSFADQLLAMSHPNMTGGQLGNLMFSQGEQEASRQHDIDLATTLRQNLRSGAPLSTSDIVGGFDRQNQNQWADRRSSATLQGLLGVLPSSAAIQTAGNLGRQVPALFDPSLSSTAALMQAARGPEAINAAEPGVSALLAHLFGGDSGLSSQQQLQNTANVNQSGDIMAAYGNGVGSGSSNGMASLLASLFGGA